MKTMLGEVEQKLDQEGYEVLVQYIRDKDRVPHICTAYIFDKADPLRDSGRPLAVGESYCHPKDNFWKKKGRHMAICRAAKQLGVI